MNATTTAAGIVVFHEWLIGAGGAERLAVEEYRFLVRSGIRSKLLCFEASPKGLFGLDPSEVEVIPRKGVLDGILQLRKRLIALNPEAVIVAGGVTELFLAMLGLAIPYALHQHEAPFKNLVYQRQALVPLIRFRAVRTIREMAFGYRHPPTVVPKRTLATWARAEVQSLLDWLAIKKAAVVFSLSTRAASEVELLYGRKAIALCGCLSEEILRYEPEEQPEHTAPKAGRRVVLSISRLDAMKRLDVVIRGFAQIEAEFNNTILMIGGTGPEEELLKALTAELGLSERIVFLGYVPDDELWSVTASCDVVVCADWTDFDIAPYEALALGRRVVWSSEVETDEELTLLGAVIAVEPTAEGFAGGMRRALAGPEVPRPALARRLQEYTWDAYFTRVIEHVLRGARKPGDATKTFQGMTGRV